MLSSHLLHAVSQAQRHGKKLALLLTDLERFKTVNDTMGHEAGDPLLQEVATRIRHCLRESDIIARLGGDEFVVLLEDVESAATIVVVAERRTAAWGHCGDPAIDRHGSDETGARDHGKHVHGPVRRQPQDDLSAQGSERAHCSR